MLALEILVHRIQPVTGRRDRYEADDVLSVGRHEIDVEGVEGVGQASVGAQRVLAKFAGIDFVAQAVNGFAFLVCGQTQCQAMARAARGRGGFAIAARFQGLFTWAKTPRIHLIPERRPFLASGVREVH